jgi:molecular chaperone DnaK
LGLALGIDLGTSNSVVAVAGPDGPVVIADADGHKVHPSVVHFGHGVHVGHDARVMMTRDPANTISSIKRLIGRRYASEEVSRLRRMVGYELVEGPNGAPRVRVRGRVYAAPEIFAKVLEYLKEMAETQLGETVDGAVITVPAYFNDLQRHATADAARIAGLPCLRIINEPTAAALAYGFGQARRQHIAVYDLGGGTFDISILRIDGDIFEVVSTAGDTFLGGDDFDMAIMEHMAGRFAGAAGAELLNHTGVMVRLRSAAEQAKIALSRQTEVRVKVPELARDAEGNSRDLDMRLDRLGVTRLVLPLMQRTFVVVDEALREANLTAGQIDKVLLVGGMSRFPSVREAVGHYFGRDPGAHLDPDQVVAMGAAIQARNLSQASMESRPVLIDVTAQSLGVRTRGDFVDVLISKNTAIPTEASKVFHTAHDNQTQVRIRVLQGGSRIGSENELLGEFVLDGLRSAPRGQVRVRVTFVLDANGMMDVEAQDVETGRAVSLLMEASSRLSEHEIIEMAAQHQLSTVLPMPPVAPPASTIALPPVLALGGESTSDEGTDDLFWDELLDDE